MSSNGSSKDQNQRHHRMYRHQPLELWLESRRRGGSSSSALHASSESLERGTGQIEENDWPVNNQPEAWNASSSSLLSNLVIPSTVTDPTTLTENADLREESATDQHSLIQSPTRSSSISNASHSNSAEIIQDPGDERSNVGRKRKGIPISLPVKRIRDVTETPLRNGNDNYISLQEDEEPSREGEIISYSQEAPLDLLDISEHDDTNDVVVIMGQDLPIQAPVSSISVSDDIEFLGVAKSVASVEESHVVSISSSSSSDFTDLSKSIRQRVSIPESVPSVSLSLSDNRNESIPIVLIDENSAEPEHNDPESRYPFTGLSMISPFHSRERVSRDNEVEFINTTAPVSLSGSSSYFSHRPPNPTVLGGSSSAYRRLHLFNSRSQQAGPSTITARQIPAANVLVSDDSDDSLISPGCRRDIEEQDEILAQALQAEEYSVATRVGHVVNRPPESLNRNSRHFRQHLLQSTYNAEASDDDDEHLQRLYSVDPDRYEDIDENGRDLRDPFFGLRPVHPSTIWPPARRNRGNFIPAQRLLQHGRQLARPRIPYYQPSQEQPFDDSYEGLLALGERIGEAKDRSVPKHVINRLPTRSFPPPSGSGKSGIADAEDGASVDLTCTVCLCDYETGDRLMGLPCAHWFHRTCITPWLDKNDICPVCRNRVRES